MAASFMTLPDGRKLSYDVSGPVDAPVVLLSNSLMTNFTVWDSFVDELLSRGFRVLRYNQPGHGTSSAPQDLSSTTFLTLSADIAKLIAELKIHKIHAWIGISMGAALGAYFVTQNPGVVQKLVMADTITSSPSNAGIPDVFAQRVELAQTDSNAIAKLTEGTLERWFSAEWMKANPAETQRMRQLMTTTTKEGFITCCHALRDASFDLRPLFRRIGSSVESALLVVGELDANLPTTMEIMRQEIQAGFGQKTQVPLIVIPKAGHVPVVDGREQFTQEVLKFIAPERAGKI
jgi:3-oxoadipate enol-lactonase